MTGFFMGENGEEAQHVIEPDENQRATASNEDQQAATNGVNSDTTDPWSPWSPIFLNSIELCQYTWIATNS
jgi:hypothetical protein